MRVQPKHNPIFKRTVWLLALGLALASTSAWAETFHLKSVDFIAGNNQTDIVLHTGSIVPVEKVLVSDNKLILDIDQIDAEETIHTNFAGAANISHVIMQPLNKNKVRMIIRGEDLGAPKVAFFNTNSQFQGESMIEDHAQLARENAEALHRIQEEGIQPATLGEPLDTAADNPETAATDIAASTDEEPISLMAPAQSVQKTLDESAPLALPAVDTTGSASLDFFEQWAGGKADKYLPFGLLGLTLLGLGIFLRRKIGKLMQREPQLEDLLEEQADGRRVSFREMADAYRNKHQSPTKAEKAGSRKPSASDVIGLGSLKQMEILPEPPAPAQEPAKPQPAPTPKGGTNNKALETLLAALQETNSPKAPAKASPPKKQAINQYMQQQAQPKAKAKSKNRAMADQLMAQEMKQRELQRAREIQQQAARQQVQPFQPEVVQRSAKPGISSPGNPINRAPAARKATKPTSATRQSARQQSQQGPLPGNPEVLNFLRNVADLMEKDGKTDIAKSIHKNLNPQNLGRV